MPRKTKAARKRTAPRTAPIETPALADLRFLDEAAGDNLDATDWRIIEFLAVSAIDVVSQNDVADAINISRRNAQGRLARLFTDGYVTNPPGRKSGVVLTNRGVAVAFRSPFRRKYLRIPPRTGF